MDRENRNGMILKNNQGCLMKIIEYNSATDMIVQFLDKYQYTFKATSFSTLKKGAYRNPFYPEKYHVGMLGDIKNISGNPDYSIAKRFWSSMIERCYSTKYHKCRKTYYECTVCEEWLVFANFYQWFHENYYEIKNEKMHLDKDILDKGNKIYSPNKCCIVPMEINELFTKSDAARGEYPIGVSWIKRDQVYRSQCCCGNKKRVALGSYSNPIDAFNAYKVYKEKVIKKIADKYKDKIPPHIYTALYNYEVDITD